jgi:hypothetical protein
MLLEFVTSFWIYSFPFSHVLLQSTKAKSWKFLWRKNYTMAGFLIYVNYHLPLWESMTSHNSNGHSCAHSSRLPCWVTFLGAFALQCWPRSLSLQESDAKAFLHKSKFFKFAGHVPAFIWNSSTVTSLVIFWWLLVWFLIFMPFWG